MRRSFNISQEWTFAYCTALTKVIPKHVLSARSLLVLILHLHLIPEANLSASCLVFVSLKLFTRIPLITWYPVKGNYLNNIAMQLDTYYLKRMRDRDR